MDDKTNQRIKEAFKSRKIFLSIPESKIIKAERYVDGEWKITKLPEESSSEKEFWQEIVSATAPK